MRTPPLHHSAAPPVLLLCAPLFALALSFSSCMIAEEVVLETPRRPVPLHTPEPMPLSVKRMLDGVKQQVGVCYARAARRRLLPLGQNRVLVQMELSEGILEITTVQGIASPHFRTCVLGIRAATPTNRGRTYNKKFSFSFTFNAHLARR